MQKYKVTLTTVVDITVTVDAENENDAYNAAFDSVREFIGQHRSETNWVTSINDEFAAFAEIKQL